MTPTDLQPLYCAWAEHEFGFEKGQVTEVKFEHVHDGGYSELTPGAGDLVEVSVRTSGSWVWQRDYSSDGLAEVIESVARFSLGWKT